MRMMVFCNSFVIGLRFFICLALEASRAFMSLLIAVVALKFVEAISELILIRVVFAVFDKTIGKMLESVLSFGF